MFKIKLVAAGTITTLLLLLVPVPSYAASWTWAPLSRPVAGLFVKIERWWHLFLNGPERPARPQPPAARKNGCGMDVNGNPLCGPNPGTGQVTAPAPADAGEN
jgi:hypothetical protein